jgi:ABC-2 type transport system ATP-binding protein
MQPVIRLEEVHKLFGAEKALDGVSLDVPPGVVFALLGENGAGKTTAIRIMLGLAEADAGHAEVLGLSSAAAGVEIRRRVGYVAERPTLYDWMTVDEIGWFTAGFYGEGFLGEYHRLVEQYQLPRKRKIQSLSKGMRAKVSLSLAVAHQPEVLILDEPTSGLDALVRREFLESMVDRAAMGQTVFLSSHQIVEVERVADYVAILHHGELATVDRLDELKAQTRELTVTLNDGRTEPPALEGTVISTRRRVRQWQYIVRGMSDQRVTQLACEQGIDDVQSRTPNLEEIFVAYMQRDARLSDGAATQPAIAAF